ncbi:MAG: EamA family transporter [Planctomycetes bacterium]|nr:EamA family transporter [Planctomycetota bacterium]
MITLSVLGAWVLSRGNGWRRLMPGRAAGKVIAMGAISIAINLLLFGSLIWTTATNHALLFRLDLIFVVLIGALLHLERIGWKPLVLLPVMLAGVALVLGVQNLDPQPHMIGDAMAVLAALFFAANAFLIRGILQTMDEESTALYNHGISTLGFLAIAFGGNQWAAAANAFESPQAWLWLVVLGVSAALTLPLYYAALRRMSVWKLRTWLLLTPVVVAGVEWLGWGTQFGGLQILGAALVLGGLLVLIRWEWREASPIVGSGRKS